MRARLLVAAVVVLVAGAARADVYNMPSGQTSLQFVTVGDPGNAPDTTVMNDGTTGYGSVPYVYQMGKYDVTVGQYCQFLNAVAATDTYGLYNGGMTDFPTLGITQSGSSGSYTYSVTGSYSQGVNCPIFDVSWGDAARFCNWLQNGQPSGPECGTTTENGAYTLNGDITSYQETRNAGAAYFIPSENEWYKAAYYKSGGKNSGYWRYPTQSNATPSNALSGTGTNNANFAAGYPGPFTYTDPTNLLTPVGAFMACPGPYGTYDMGGDVMQWNEDIVSQRYNNYRVRRGDDWDSDPTALASYFRYNASPTGHDILTGFRVASLVVPSPVPEPGSITLLIAASLSLLACACR
jgi:formylglycine-generating enzyme required for sulfatase activity